MAEGLGDLFNELGAEIIPELFSAIAPDTMNVLRKEMVDDGGGCQRETWPAVNATPIPCIAQQKLGYARDKAVENSRWEVISTWEILCRSGIDITKEDRIQLITRGTLAGRTLSIADIDPVMGVLNLVKAKEST